MNNHGDSQSRQSPHLCLACGGTGGHFYPALAIAREFQNRGGRVTMVIAGHHSDEQLRQAAAHGLAAVLMQARRLPRGPVAALAFPFHFILAWRQARRILHELQPDLVLGMGSFASVPLGLAAATLKIPLVLHEGNSRTGRANRFLSRWAGVMATSLPPEPGQAIHCPQQRTGLPLRPELIAAAARPVVPEDYVQANGLIPERPVLLVFGGSQGASFLNAVLPRSLGLLPPELRNRFQVLHFSGREEENQPLRERYAQAGIQAVVKQNETAMAKAYLLAGLVVCRAGASTISELALFGKPVILIPFPAAAEDHQTANAAAVAGLNAGLHLPQAAVTPERLAEQIGAWLREPGAFRAWGENIRQLALPAAAGAMAELLTNQANKRG